MWSIYGNYLGQVSGTSFGTIYDITKDQNFIYVSDSKSFGTNGVVQILDHQGNFDRSFEIQEVNHFIVGLAVDLNFIYITNFLNFGADYQILIYNHDGTFFNRITQRTSAGDLIIDVWGLYVIGRFLYVLEDNQERISIFEYDYIGNDFDYKSEISTSGFRPGMMSGNDTHVLISDFGFSGVDGEIRVYQFDSNIIIPLPQICFPGTNNGTEDDYEVGLGAFVGNFNDLDPTRSFSILGIENKLANATICVEVFVNGELTETVVASNLAINDRIYIQTNDTFIIPGFNNYSISVINSLGYQEEWWTTYYAWVGSKPYDPPTIDLRVDGLQIVDSVVFLEYDRNRTMVDITFSGIDAEPFTYFFEYRNGLTEEWIINQRNQYWSNGESFQFMFDYQLGLWTITLGMRDLKLDLAFFTTDLWIQDTIAPIIDSGAQTQFNISDMMDFSWNFSDESNGTYEIFVDDLQQATGMFDYTGSASLLDLNLTAGIHNITVVATDFSNNTVVETLSVEVIDPNTTTSTSETTSISTGTTFTTETMTSVSTSSTGNQDTRTTSSASTSQSPSQSTTAQEETSQSQSSSADATTATNAPSTPFPFGAFLVAIPLLISFFRKMKRSRIH